MNCKHIIPAYFDEHENPIGVCCELLDAADGKLFWMEVDMGLRQLPKLDASAPKPVPVR